MTRENQISIAGTVTDVFAHRVVVETDTGKLLADLGPASLDVITLATGMHILLTGEMKPSELKADTVCVDAGPLIQLRADKKHDAHDGVAGPEVALSSVSARGFVVIGAPNRKPKHFEILAKDPDGALHELHVEFDGAIRKTKPADRSNPKWSDKAERHQA